MAILSFCFGVAFLLMASMAQGDPGILYLCFSAFFFWLGYCLLPAVRARLWVDWEERLEAERRRRREEDER